MCAQPSDLYQVWQVNLWLESLKEFGYSDKAQVLIYHDPATGEPHEEWFKLFDRYPEAKFFIYDDVDKVNRLFSIYVSILRPYILKKHFKAHPELKNKAIFYCDCDIILTGKLGIEKYLQDNVNYLSDTRDYINSDYLLSKLTEECIDPKALEASKTRDVLAELAALSGISKDVLIRNKETAGGAQYLLKNIDWHFWESVFNVTLAIRMHLMDFNQSYMQGKTPGERENKGFQSWCADMWGVLHTLWALDRETAIVPEMEFAHANSEVEKLKEAVILHNAGIESSGKLKARIVVDGKKERVEVECPAFYKGKYIEESPFRRLDEVEEVANDTVSKQYCTAIYADKLLQLQAKYGLTY